MRARDARRELAQNAAASRYATLRGYLAAELRTLPATGNTLAASIGELEERLDRGDRPGPAAAPSAP